MDSGKVLVYHAVFAHLQNPKLRHTRGRKEKKNEAVKRKKKLISEIVAFDMVGKTIRYKCWSLWQSGP